MATVGDQKGAGGEDGIQNGFQEVAKTVQDAAKTRENESKKCGHARQIRCFRKVGATQRPRRAKYVRMIQVLVRGRTDRREKEPKCGHCRGPERCRAKSFLQN